MSEDKKAKLKTDVVEYQYLQNLIGKPLEKEVIYILECQARKLPTYEQLRCLWYDSFVNNEPLEPIPRNNYRDMVNEAIYHVMEGLRGVNVSLDDSAIMVNRMMSGELMPRTIKEIYKIEREKRRENVAE